MLRTLVIIAWLLTLSIGTAAEPIAGIGPTGKVELVRGNFQFLEGPTRAPDGSLYFTDIPAQTIYVLSTNGSIEIFMKDSKHANGLMYGGNGKLLACQMDGQLASIDLKTKSLDVLASEYEGKRFNACNDLVIDKQGGIYFTDPRFSAPMPWPQVVEAFYYRTAGGEVKRLGDGIEAPNGIILSPNEGTLYVVPSMQKQVYAFEVLEPGKVGPRRVFCELKQPGSSTNSGGDGLTVDLMGNLYITTGLGVQVYAPDGKMLGLIEVPESPANVTFGGPDNRTLYITARKGLYRCEMEATGHQFRSK